MDSSNTRTQRFGSITSVGSESTHFIGDERYSSYESNIFGNIDDIGDNVVLYRRHSQAEGQGLLRYSPPGKFPLKPLPTRKHGCCGWFQKLSACKKTLVLAGFCWLLLTLISILMFTVGIKTLAIFAVNTMYPPEFDIRHFKFENLTIGPMAGNEVRISIGAVVPNSLPADVSIGSPMTVRVSYIPPFIEGHERQGETLYIGETLMLNDELLLYASPNYNATLNMSLFVENPLPFAVMVDHVLTCANTSFNNFTSSMNKSLSGMDFTQPVILKIDVTVSRVTVLTMGTPFIAISDFPIQKTVLLRSPSEDWDVAFDDGFKDASTLFSFLSRMLAGDPSLMYHVTEYLFLSNLTLYDSAYGEFLPPVFKEFNPFEADEERTRFESIRDGFVGIVDPVNTNGSETLPFSVTTTFWNPTNVQLDLLGMYHVCLNYHGTCIANVSVPDMHLSARSNTSVMVYGYLRQTHGKEDILNNILPNALLKVMTSHVHTDLPFSISGIGFKQNYFTPIFDGERVEGSVELPQDLPPRLYSNSLELAVQQVLQRRDVQVGRMYTQFGPDGPNGTLAVDRLFADFPVLGVNGLQDVLQGMRLHIRWKLLAAKIPVSAFLANPFACGIGIRKVDLAVFIPPYIVDEPIGWVTEIRDDSMTENAFPLLMPPMFNVDNPDIPLVRLNSTLADSLIANVEPQFMFLFNMKLFKSVRDALKQVSSALKTSEFRISLRFDKLYIQVGRMEMNFYNLSEHSISGIPLFPSSVIKKFGWMKLFRTLFGQGWNLART